MYFCYLPVLKDHSKLKALVYLLEDNDPVINEQVSKELVAFGSEIIPFLEDSTFLVENELHKNRLDKVIYQIKDQKIYEALTLWLKTENKDLLQAWCIVSELSGITPNYQEIKNTLDQIKLSVWLSMFNDQSSLEKIQLLNHVFFEKNGFQGDNENYRSVANSYVHDVIERKKGNPISLSVLYMLVAQSLKLPVYGINLPQHFVLAYMPLDLEKTFDLTIEDFSGNNEIPIMADLNADAVFYINPFNKGAIFSKFNLKAYLKELKIEPKEQFFQVCDEVAIVKRMLRNIQSSHVFLNKEEDKLRVDKLLSLFDE